eukprot:2837809-Amphidinium_carterae.1
MGTPHLGFPKAMQDIASCTVVAASSNRPIRFSKPPRLRGQTPKPQGSKSVKNGQKSVKIWGVCPRRGFSQHHLWHVALNCVLFKLNFREPHLRRYGLGVGLATSAMC